MPIRIVNEMCGTDLYQKLGIVGPVTRGFDVGPVRKGGPG